MQGIEIQKLQPMATAKGTTLEWCKGLAGQQVSIYRRNKGIIFGNHFHTGSDPSKNPERFLLLEGSIKIYAKNRQGEEMDIVIDAGTELTISPYIYHSMTALSDVLFIEYRSTVFDTENDDCFSLGQFF